jgi:endonuclease YncB( thermonuclease family)
MPRGIDGPEKGQAFWKRPKQAAPALVFEKDVTLQTHGYDKHKRTLADVLLPDGTNINHELVKDGWCWWYRTENCRWHSERNRTV